MTLPLRVVSSTLWVVAFATWVAVEGLSVQRFTFVFWVVTGLVAFTLGTRPWWQAPFDWSPIIAFFVLYDMTRGAADSLGFPTRWEGPPFVDRILGFGHVPTVWLQERIAARHDRTPWWELLPAAVYMSFFVVPFLVAAVLWLRSRPAFGGFMARLALVSAIGLVCYVVVPAAPPWAAARCTHAEVADHPSDPPCLYRQVPSDRGDTVLRRLYPDDDDNSIMVRRITSRGWDDVPGLQLTSGFIRTGIDSSNRVAAVPSLHAASALLVSAFLWPRARRRWRPLLLAYPPAMAFALVWGGDHYVVDVLLGWAAVGLAFVVVGRVERWLARRADEPEPDPDPDLDGLVVA